MSLVTRYSAWAWRQGGRRVRKLEATRRWAEEMNARINELPQWQQDQLDAQILGRVLGQ